MTKNADHHVESYLRRLERELDDLPSTGRRELMEAIGQHIDEARSELAPDDEVGLLTVLQRLGDPEDIAAEARGRRAVRARVGGRELLAVVLLVVGGVVLPVVGWVVGVVLLWASEAWTKKDKVIGTLVVPGGLLFPLALVAVVASADYFLGYQTCVEPEPGSTAAPVCSDPITTGDHAVWVGAEIVLVAALLLAAGYLIRRARTGLQPITHY